MKPYILHFTVRKFESGPVENALATGSVGMSGGDCIFKRIAMRTQPAIRLCREWKTLLHNYNLSCRQVNYDYSLYHAVLPVSGRARWMNVIIVLNYNCEVIKTPLHQHFTKLYYQSYSKLRLEIINFNKRMRMQCGTLITCALKLWVHYERNIIWY